MKVLRACLIACLPLAALAGNLPPIGTVFVIVLENMDWASVQGTTNAPFMNNMLLPQASYCRQYYNPPGMHPSEADYLWLEAGTNFGVVTDADPATNHQNTTNHLVTQLDSAGISWRTYQEDISGEYVPITETNLYVPRHNPFVYFDDVTGTNDATWPYGIAHIRPYAELAADLTNNTVARYNFITPNLCHDGHDSCAPLYNPVLQADNWLAAELPQILSSPAYQMGGALFITWDEGATGDGPIGMIVVSPWGRGAGYASTVRYTHSSMVRTLQEIFGVSPWLGDAANATNLGELFAQFGFSSLKRLDDGTMELTATAVLPGRTHLVEASVDFIEWRTISTNVASAYSFTLRDCEATNVSQRFYRLVQVP